MRSPQPLPSALPPCRKSPSHSSPLRYPGGKGRFLKFAQSLYRENGLEGGAYAEPYAGGAGLALGLLQAGTVSEIHINDIDHSVYAFWHSVLNETEAFCKRVQDCRVDVDTWRTQKAVYALRQSAQVLDLGFAAFFLNRTNRSGIIRGGPIGGMKQDGAWKIDARFPRRELIGRIQAIAKLKRQIRIYNLDAIDFIALCAGTLPSKSLMYLDPPYYLKAHRLYASYYKAEDHIQVASILPSLPWPWIVSYDAAPEILRLYHHQRRHIYGIDYTASTRYKGAEVMVFSGELTIPGMSSPIIERGAA